MGMTKHMTNKLEDIKKKLEKLDKEARDKKAKIEAEAKGKSEKLKNQLKRLEQAETAKERKRDSRRKIVAGSAFLAHMEKDPAFADQARGILQKYLTRDIDRELFDLPKAKTAET